MASPCPVLHTLADHAAALAALPAGGPLPVRTAVVSSERHAHALRRAVCAEHRQPELLAGVRLLHPVALARDVLLRAGVACSAGLEDLRRLRLFQLFQSRALDGRLRYFSLHREIRHYPTFPSPDCHMRLPRGEPHL